MKVVRKLLLMIPILTGSLILVVFTILLLVRVDTTIEAYGEVKFGQYQVVRSKFGGMLAKVWVEPGDYVRSDQTLFQVEDIALNSEMRQIEREIVENEENLNGALLQTDLLVTEIQPLEVENLMSEIESLVLEAMRYGVNIEEAQLIFKARKKRLERLQGLSKSGLLSLDDLDMAANEALAAESRLEKTKIEEKESRARLERSRKALSLLRTQHRHSLLRLETDMGKTESLIRRLKGRLAHLEVQATALTVRAAFDGILVGKPVKEILGKRIDPGEAIFDIVDVKDIVFEGKVPENAILRVRPGQEAYIEISGLPKMKFDVFWGVVRAADIKSEMEAVQGRVLFPVKISLDKAWVQWEDGQFYLRHGMRGKANIVQRRDVSLLKVAFDLLTGNPT